MRDHRRQIDLDVAELRIGAHGGAAARQPGRQLEYLRAARVGDQAIDHDVALDQAVAAPVLRHRIVTNFNAEAEGLEADDIVAHLIQTIPVADETNAA